jgi:hypothetical protein
MKSFGKVLFFVGISIMISLGCQNSKANADKVVKSKQGSEFPINIPVGGTFQDLDILRKQVRALIDYRIKQNPDPLAFITYAYWYPEFVASGGKVSAEHKYLGYWLKFNDDFTYTYGKYDEIHGSGHYHFRLDDDNMLMVDDDPSIEPKIWQANHNGEAIALVGQHDYGMNNGIQMKMIPLDARPVKEI